MPPPDKTPRSEEKPFDLLAVIRRSGVLAGRQYETICEKVRDGSYPRDPATLADRLVRDGVLTRYQAERLLRNKPHGLVVDRYVILERIGEGGMGRVYKAHHRLLGRVVALKVISPQFASRARSAARFQREIRLIGRLDHPHIVRAFDADELGSAFYLVMEYVSGRNLDTVLEERGPLPVGEVFDYAAQAAMALAHAHERGILHRDIKPSNLLLSDDGQIKLLDLGLGTLIDPAERTSFATAAGHAVGTVDYMAPELLTGGELDGRSDLFGLGCTMYVLLTDRPPYDGETELERITRRLRESPDPIVRYRPDMPAAATQLLDRLLARRPDDRFQTASEAAEALRSLAGALPIGPPPDHPSPPPSLEPTASSPWSATLGVRTSESAGASAMSSPTSETAIAEHGQARVCLQRAESYSWAALLLRLAVLLAVFLTGFAVGHRHVDRNPPAPEPVKRRMHSATGRSPHEAPTGAAQRVLEGRP